MRTRSEDVSNHIRLWKDSRDPLKVDVRSKDEWVVTFTFDGKDVVDKDDHVIIQKPDKSYISFRKDAVQKAEDHKDGSARLYFRDQDTFMEVHPTVSNLKS